MYAIIAVYITSKCIEVVFEGLHFGKAAFIVSDKSEEISEEVLKVMKRGATGLKGMGMFTKVNKTVLLVVVSVKEIVILKEIVNKIDKKSFIIVTDVREVLGEGFKDLG